MRINDIIERKRDKKELTKEEINFFVTNYSNGTIPDYQISSLLMAIFLNGLTKSELGFLTLAMANSSDKLDLSELKKDGKIIVDKHSTGGVGDKVTLIALPIVAAMGGYIYKMSGKGLGITGGTADKLESIVGYDINISLDRAKNQIKDIGVALMSQNEEIAIADKKLYSLRNATGTVESPYLIASSVMSKKIAGGADKLVLEVPCGSGAFMKNLEDAKELASLMVELGKLAKIETKAIITNMSTPIGRTVGNAIEIKEVISFLLSDEETLANSEIADLKEIVFEVCAYMLKLSGLGDDIEKNKIEILKCITSKKAYNKFIELIKAQGGHICNVYMDWIGMNLDMPVLKDNVTYMKEIYAEESGYIVSIDCKKIGEALIYLGGGRLKKDDIIDYAVGFEFKKETGDYVNKKDVILTVMYNDKIKFEEAFSYLKDAIYIENIDKSLANALKNEPHILDIL